MKNILIVEDEDFLSRVLKDNLAAEGYRTRVARDGEQALEFLRQEKPDLIILDLVLPLRSGFDVLQELKKDTTRKDVPVIVLSNLGGSADVRRALDLGANAYMVKSDNTILEVIDAIKKFVAAK